MAATDSGEELVDPGSPNGPVDSMLDDGDEFARELRAGPGQFTEGSFPQQRRAGGPHPAVVEPLRPFVERRARTGSGLDREQARVTVDVLGRTAECRTGAADHRVPGVGQPADGEQVLTQFVGDARHLLRVRGTRPDCAVPRKSPLDAPVHRQGVLGHAERLCERIAIISGGKIAFEGAVDEARDRLRPIVRLRTRSDDGPWRSAIPDNARHERGEWVFELPPGGPEPLLKALLDGDAGIETLAIERPGLHDAFVAIAGDAAAAAMGDQAETT